MRKVSSASSRAPSKALLPLFAVLLLLASAPVASGLRTQDTNLPYSTSISSGYYEYYPITTVSASSTVSFVVSSNTPVSTALMSSSQFYTFNTTATTDLADSLFIVNASSAQENLHEPIGTYYLVLYAYGSNANVYYNLVSYPIDPYYYVPLTPPQPTGIASFGIYNESGNGVPYQVETNEVVGIGEITALQAYNATAGSDQSNISGATLQLNTVLLVNETDGNQQSYWVQNTPDFVTSANTVAFGDNIWNFSVSGVLSNTTVTSSNGPDVFAFSDDGSTDYYYSYEAGNMSYALPLGIALLANETVESGTGVLVQLGAQLFENGGLPITPVEWFDNATITDPLVQSAYYFVSGNQTTPDGLYYDTELVFAGENNGEATDFTQMSSSLGLFYDNSATGTLESFPSLYSFGGDTSEGADNLQVSYSGNGFAQLSTGTPNYEYLGQTSGTISFPLSAFSNATTTSTQSSSTSSASVTSQSSSSSISLSAPSTLVLFAAAITTALMLGNGSRLRSKRASPAFA